LLLVFNDFYEACYCAVTIEHLLPVIHLPAGIGAFTAHSCTFFTMFIVVLATFFSTGIAGIGAYSAKAAGMAAVQAHKLCRCVAQGSTLHIQSYTFRHHLHVRLFSAR
jgi:hypothetical protein